jgi:hypothetical protein
VIVIARFEVPIAKAINGLASCFIEQYDDSEGQPTFLRVSFAVSSQTWGWNGQRGLTEGWKVLWLGNLNRDDSGMESDMSEDEKIVIDQYAQRLYKLRAFL